LFTLARRLLEARHQVVLDAAFLEKQQRDSARSVAANLGVDPVLVIAEASVEVLRERIRKRAAAQNVASEADLAVLDHQLGTVVPVPDDDMTIRVDTSLDIDTESLLSAILERCGR
jgi:predicted kinase